MSILSRIRKGFPITLKKRSIYLDDVTGQPKTIIATGGTTKGGGIGASTERSEASLKKYRDYYEGENTVFAAINTTAWNAVMVGYNIISEDENAKKLVQYVLDRIDLNSVLLDNIVYALIYGDAFIEVVKTSADDVVALKTVDPVTMNINYDKFGVITGYQQKIKGVLQSTILLPTDIIHLKFFSNPGDPYGMSLIEPSKETIDRKVATDEALANAIIRHGTPKYKITVGTPEAIPPPTAFTDIKTELEDLTALNEIIIPGLVNIEALDEKGVPGVEEYSNLFQTQLVIGMLCPEEALGLGKGSTEATAKIKEVMYERFIQSIQTKVSEQIRTDLINQILQKNGFYPNIVKMKFNSVTDADEAVKAKWLGDLLRGYDIRRGEIKPFSVNEVRHMFGYPPIKGGDDLAVVTPEGPSQPQQPQPQPKPQENVPNETPPSDGGENNRGNQENV